MPYHKSVSYQEIEAVYVHVQQSKESYRRSDIGCYTLRPTVHTEQVSTIFYSLSVQPRGLGGSLACTLNLSLWKIAISWPQKICDFYKIHEIPQF